MSAPGASSITYTLQYEGYGYEVGGTVFITSMPLPNQGTEGPCAPDTTFFDGAVQDFVTAVNALLSDLGTDIHVLSITKSDILVAGLNYVGLNGGSYSGALDV
jgi:hypothetical protein